MIRVLLADDHHLVRHGLTLILQAADDIVVVGEAADGRETLALAGETDFDVLLLDIGLPKIHGLDVLRQLQAHKPDLPVLILSVYPEKQYAVRTLKLGAAGYLTKDSAPEELVSAVRQVAAGLYYISLSIARQLTSNQLADLPRHNALSDREFQVLQLFADGKTTSEIAYYLSLSVKTISEYRARILNKLGLETTADIIRYALEHKLEPDAIPPLSVPD